MCNESTASVLVGFVTRTSEKIRLRYMKSKLHRGRCLALPVAIGPQILPGDSLQPSRHLMSIHDLEHAAPPLTLAFWQKEFHGEAVMDSVVHRNPIYSDALVTNPARTLAVDSLHTLYYGPIQRWVFAAIWRILMSNPWRIRGDKEKTIRRWTQTAIC